MTLVVVLAAAVLIAVVLGWVAVVRYRRLLRLLARQRAVHQVTGAALERDIDALRTRLRALGTDGASAAVLAEAGRVLDAALTAHHNSPEGGNP